MTPASVRCGLTSSLALLAGAAIVTGCGAAAKPPAGPVSSFTSTGAAIPPAVLAGARPIGRGPRFTPPATGRPTGGCAAPLGRRYQAHIEVFAENRVVLLAAGIGARGPLRSVDGRVTGAACFGAAVTLDPTGTVYFRPGRRVTLGSLFAAWGQRLSADRIASFTGGTVRTYLDGRPHLGAARQVTLSPDAEIVLEIGAYVPPHRSFTFPATPSPSLP